MIAQHILAASISTPKYTSTTIIAFLVGVIAGFIIRGRWGGG